MGLDKKPLSKAENTGALRRLYHTAFPKEEQMPWWILRLTSLRRDMGVEGFYEGDRLRGFTHSVATEDVLFLLFFAVNDDCRGQGWGSEILTKLKAENPGRTVVLNVELLDPEANNYDQRLRRMAFYKRNGFFDTGYDVDEVGGTFRVLATKPELDVDAYLRAFGKLSFGFWKPYVRKGKDYGSSADA
jgi:GNAT superfamily N-acetyltransferase